MSKSRSRRKSMFSQLTEELLVSQSLSREEDLRSKFRRYAGYKETIACDSASLEAMLVAGCGFKQDFVSNEGFQQFLKEQQYQADKDHDGQISFTEFVEYHNLMVDFSADSQHYNWACELLFTHDTSPRMARRGSTFTDRSLMGMSGVEGGIVIQEVDSNSKANEVSSASATTALSSPPSIMRQARGGGGGGRRSSSAIAFSLSSPRSPTRATSHLDAPTADRIHMLAAAHKAMCSLNKIDLRNMCRQYKETNNDANDGLMATFPLSKSMQKRFFDGKKNSKSKDNKAPPGKNNNNNINNSAKKGKSKKGDMSISDPALASEGPPQVVITIITMVMILMGYLDIDDLSDPDPDVTSRSNDDDKDKAEQEDAAEQKTGVPEWWNDAMAKLSQSDFVASEMKSLVDPSIVKPSMITKIKSKFKLSGGKNTNAKRKKKLKKKIKKNKNKKAKAVSRKSLASILPIDLASLSLGQSGNGNDNGNGGTDSKPVLTREIILAVRRRLAQLPSLIASSPVSAHHRHRITVTATALATATADRDTDRETDREVETDRVYNRDRFGWVKWTNDAAYALLGWVICYLAAAEQKDYLVPSPTASERKRVEEDALLATQGAIAKAAMESATEHDDSAVRNAAREAATAGENGKAKFTFHQSSTARRGTIYVASPLDFDMMTVYTKRDKKCAQPGIKVKVGMHDETKKEEVLAVVFDRTIFDTEEKAAAWWEVNYARYVRSDIRDEAMKEMLADASKAQESWGVGLGGEWTKINTNKEKSPEVASAASEIAFTNFFSPIDIKALNSDIQQLLEVVKTDSDASEWNSCVQSSRLLTALSCVALLSGRVGNDTNMISNEQSQSVSRSQMKEILLTDGVTLAISAAAIDAADGDAATKADLSSKLVAWLESIDVWDAAVDRRAMYRRVLHVRKTYLGNVDLLNVRIARSEGESDGCVAVLRYLRDLLAVIQTEEYKSGKPKPEGTIQEAVFLPKPPVDE